jgi:Uma2 family endonuclease
VIIRYQPLGPPPVVYPDSDGKPMAEHEWQTVLRGNLEYLFRDRPDVLVGGGRPIFPDAAEPEASQTPNVYVAFDRANGRRTRSKVWEEGGIFPQVVFEVQPPKRQGSDVRNKRRFYCRYGVEEYYVFHLGWSGLTIWVRDREHFVGIDVDEPNGFISPRLGLHFRLTEEAEVITSLPDGRPLLTVPELRALIEQSRADRLAAKLRELGLDPDTV